MITKQNPRGAGRKPKPLEQKGEQFPLWIESRKIEAIGKEELKHEIMLFVDDLYKIYLTSTV